MKDGRRIVKMASSESRIEGFQTLKVITSYKRKPEL